MRFFVNPCCLFWSLHYRTSCGPSRLQRPSPIKAGCGKTVVPLKVCMTSDSASTTHPFPATRSARFSRMTRWRSAMGCSRWNWILAAERLWAERAGCTSACRAMAARVSPAREIHGRVQRAVSLVDRTSIRWPARKRFRRGPQLPRSHGGNDQFAGGVTALSASQINDLRQLMNWPCFTSGSISIAE